MARPTKYTPEMLEKAREYLSNYEDLGDVVPQIAGLAIHLEISRETVYDWARQDDKSEFSDIVEAILSGQERGLFNKGLRGDINPTLAKLGLAKHGYHDKQDNTHSGPGGGPIEQVQRVERVIVRSGNTTDSDG